MPDKVNRDKLLSLRIADGDYEVLRRLFRKSGYRSASEFVRHALKKMVEAGPVPPPPIRLDEMGLRLEKLRANVAHLGMLSERLLAEVPVEPEPQPVELVSPDNPSRAAAALELRANLDRTRARFDQVMEAFLFAGASDPGLMEAISAEREIAWNDLNFALKQWQSFLTEKPPSASASSSGC